MIMSVTAHMSPSPRARRCPVRGLALVEEAVQKCGEFTAVARLQERGRDAIRQLGQHIPGAAEPSFGIHQRSAEPVDRSVSVHRPQQFRRARLRHRQREAAFQDLCTGCPVRERCTSQGGTHRDHPPGPQPAGRCPPPGRRRPQPASRLPVPETPGRTRRRLLVHQGNRKLPYRGTIKNNTWIHTRAATLILRRLINLGLTRTNNTWTLTPAST